MAETVRLTTTAKAAGCAAKLSPSILENVLKRLPQQRDPNVLVGFETSDDAAVYKLSDDLALVQTVDFFTAIVDEPDLFGQVAATNALSDVFAMGGRPISALTIVAFPTAQPPEVLEEVLRGGLTKMIEANCTVVGGHSIRDDEIKFGYAVTGLIDPRKVWRNVGARPGDTLILTKPLGTGVIATALKQGHAEPEWIAASVASMTRLNRDAAEALHEIDDAAGSAKPVHAVTDVTGFGLLGHSREMAIGSGVSIRIDPTRIAYLPGAIDAARGGFLSGGLANNRQFVEGCAQFAPSIPEEFRSLVLDPQTSGGLLASVAPEAVPAALAAFERRKVPARVIGEVLAKRSPLIEVA
ncbi:MAG TPA: selenide, water dikinase SelD [Candidatus Baltobacteraceae bacterium]|nr:selenide, water dikinase SelD [Candidatus Baltobacteraceae bacterium]